MKQRPSRVTIDAAFAEADRLVKQYADLLEQPEAFISLTELPASPDEIREALLVEATVRVEQGMIQEDQLALYRSAFAALLSAQAPDIVATLRNGMRIGTNAGGVARMSAEEVREAARAIGSGVRNEVAADALDTARREVLKFDADLADLRLLYREGVS